MKQEHIEQKLRDAVDHAAPAFSEGLGAEAARGVLAEEVSYADKFVAHARLLSGAALYLTGGAFFCKVQKKAPLDKVRIRNCRPLRLTPWRTS